MSDHLRIILSDFSYVRGRKGRMLRFSMGWSFTRVTKDGTLVLGDTMGGCIAWITDLLEIDWSPHYTGNPGQGRSGRQLHEITPDLGLFVTAKLDESKLLEPILAQAKARRTADEEQDPLFGAPLPDGIVSEL